MKITFQNFLTRLTSFWEKQGCIVHQGYDLEVGAGTFNPATFLRALGPEPYKAAYIEPCRRPTDGRYGTNPNRLQHYFQYQVILKPSPLNIQELYLQSLEALGFDLKEHDIRFVHDDWESPTLGAWGLGWEVWMDGMEITQFTYFQAIGGVDLHPITGEITYGIERLAIYLQKVNSIFDLQWNDSLTYGDIYHQNEVEWSHYNFEEATTAMWKQHFEDYEKEAKKMIAAGFPIPAYDFVMKASHAFNLMDARGAISVTERTGYIGRIRELAQLIAGAYISSREKQGFPLLKHAKKENSPVETPSSSLKKDSAPLIDDFLLEIGSEEMPATFVPIGKQNLEKEMRLLLLKEELPFEEIELFATPRRLAILVRGLVREKKAKVVEKRGPPLAQAYDSGGDLTATGEGFFRSLSLPPLTLNALNEGKSGMLQIREIKGVSYLFATLKQEAQSSLEILQQKLPSLIQSIEFPKKMRWSDLQITYARPVKWIVALYGNEEVPFHFGPILSGNHSYGHRQLNGERVKIEKASDYEATLRNHWVLVSMEERKREIIEQLERLEEQEGFLVTERERVLPQVINLVEWPFITFASFQPEFLRLPKEVLISEMVEHQKYFPVLSKKGEIEHYFVITADNKPTDSVRQGNQKVLSARLSDGAFLFEEDLKHSLDYFNEKLKKVTFQKSLGTLYQKVERIQGHAESLQRLLNLSSPALVSRAAQLCKADLASNMVYEFPELQGVMGTYYALAQKEEPEVALAIDEQWMPRGEKAPLPSTQTGVILSLADKIDNLLGCFAVGLKPTSSSDPYALRRQVLGIIKMMIQGAYRFSLKEGLTLCAAHFPNEIMRDQKAVIGEILLFIFNRLKSVFLEYGFAKDEIEATLSNESDDIYDAFCKVKALHDFREGSHAAFCSLLEVYKRAKGQLQGHLNGDEDETLLVEPSEKLLTTLLKNQEEGFKDSLKERNYKKAFGMIADFQQPLAQLFDHVKILADQPELRRARLSLLRRVFNRMEEIVDFGKIQEK